VVKFEEYHEDVRSMQKKLKFKGKYKEALISGRKKTTLRLSTELKPGDIVILEAGEEELGEAVIERVLDIRIEELTDKHAAEDGFSSKAELLRELKSIYGSSVLREGTRLKLIKFELRKGEVGEK